MANRKATAKAKDQKDQKGKKSTKPDLKRTYKLGSKATLFVDPEAQTKIAGNQKVEFTDVQMATDKFRNAVTAGHIVRCTEEDFEEPEETVDELDELEEDENQALAEFLALPTNADKAKYLKDTYDNTEEEELVIDGMTTEQLIAEFKKSEGINE